MSTRGHVPAENMRLWRQQLEENRKAQEDARAAMERFIGNKQSVHGSL